MAGIPGYVRTMRASRKRPPSTPLFQASAPVRAPSVVSPRLRPASARPRDSVVPDRRADPPPRIHDTGAPLMCGRWGAGPTRCEHRQSARNAQLPRHHTRPPGSRHKGLLLSSRPPVPRQNQRRADPLGAPVGCGAEQARYYPSSPAAAARQPCPLETLPTGLLTLNTEFSCTTETQLT